MIFPSMTHFSLQITEWYRQNKRNLPWRATTDPYKVWISEIILQQTRVDQGLNYYLRFVEAFPTIEHLSEASENEVLRMWQGLGYYSRARNLHQTAQFIHHEMNGKFPNLFKELIKLKGIGPYTAAAIASFCFKEAVPVLDGNVFRVLSRYFGIDHPIDLHASKKLFSDLAQQLISPTEPDTFNQAIMEFGALQCTPQQTDCSSCPLKDSCDSLANGKVRLRPVKSKKTKVTNRYFHYLHFDDGKQVVLEKRIKKDIWQNLFQFPLIETTENSTYDDIKSLVSLEPHFESRTYTHLLSHQKIHATFYHFSEMTNDLKENWITIPSVQLDDYPLPQLIIKYLEEKHQGM